MSKDPRERLIGAAVDAGYMLIVLSRDPDSTDLVCGWWDIYAQMWDSMDYRTVDSVEEWLKTSVVIIPPADE